MKRLLNLIIVLFCLSPFSFAQDQEYYELSYARMSYVQGDVFIQRAEDLGYEEGVVNLTLVAGDKLGTRAGRAEIHLGRKNYLRLDQYTHVDIVGLPRPGQNVVKLHVISGNVFLRINFMEREKDVEVHSPDASFYILDLGLYQLRVNESAQTELRVIEGAAEAAGESRSHLVQSGERLLASSGDFMSDPMRLDARYNDAFSEWNRGRDALYNRAIDRAYLPAELDAYEEELAYAGDWVYERPYGYVWVPHVHHATWRPYYNGRWLWYPIIGWNWISYDPWGWCVSHYGRWHWRLGLGWYWIPRCGWGPAWVHWYHGAHYHGWCPLSYYGYPGVIVNNHYYGNNHYYYNNYPAGSRAMTVVRKHELQNRNISRAALNPNEARKLGKVSLSARQPSQRLSVKTAGTRSSAAAKVMARSSMRSVKRNFSAAGSSQSVRTRSSSAVQSRTSSQLRSGTAKTGTRSLQKRSSAGSINRNSAASRLSGSARSARSSPGVKTYNSRTSLRGNQNNRLSSSSIRKSSTRQLAQGNSRAAPKRYNSRNLTSATSSRSSNRTIQNRSASKGRQSTVRTTRQSSTQRSNRAYTSRSTVRRSQPSASNSRTTNRTIQSRSTTRNRPTTVRTTRQSSTQRSNRSSMTRSSTQRRQSSAVRSSPSRRSSPSSSYKRTSPSSRTRMSSTQRSSSTRRASPSRSVRSSSSRKASSSRSVRSSSSRKASSSRSIRSSSSSKRTTSSRTSSVSRRTRTRVKK